MIFKAEQYLKHHWEALLHKPSPQRLWYIALPGSVEGGSATLLVFADNASAPSLVMRAMRREEFQDGLSHEYSILQLLGTLSESMRSSFPKPLFLESFGEVEVLGEEYMYGKAKGGTFTEEEWEAILRWLVRFQRETEKPLNGMSPKDVISQEVDQYVSFFSVSLAQRREMEQLFQQSGLADTRKTQVLLHNDFVPHNILFSGAFLRKPYVIDWMSAGYSPFPIFDLFLFLTVYALQSREKEGIRGYKDAFERVYLKKEGNEAQMAKKIISLYCAQMDIPPRAIFALLLLFLIDRANKEYRQTQALIEFGVMPRWSLYMKTTEKKRYAEAIGENIWTHLAGVLLEKKISFIVPYGESL